MNYKLKVKTDIVASFSGVEFSWLFEGVKTDLVASGVEFSWLC